MSTKGPSKKKDETASTPKKKHRTVKETLHALEEKIEGKLEGLEETLHIHHHHDKKKKKDKKDKQDTSVEAASTKAAKTEKQSQSKPSVAPVVEEPVKAKPVIPTLAVASLSASNSSEEESAPSTPEATSPRSEASCETDKKVLKEMSEEPATARAEETKKTDTEETPTTSPRAPDTRTWKEAAEEYIPGFRLVNQNVFSPGYQHHRKAGADVTAKVTEGFSKVGAGLSSLKARFLPAAQPASEEAPAATKQSPTVSR